MTSWEDAIRKEFGASKKRINIKRIIVEKLDNSDFLHTKSVAKVALFLLKKFNQREGILSFYVRSFLTRLFKYDPLGEIHPSPIEIYFLVASKDLLILPYSIVAAISSTTNVIQKITVVCPSNIKHEVSARIENISNATTKQIMVETDEEVLRRCDISDFNFCSSVSKMETLKLCVTMNTFKNALIVDADTLLLRKRNWLSNQTQITPIAQEYLFGHNIFFNRFFKVQSNSGIGFVTHHGLLRGEAVTELVENCGGISALAFAIDYGVKVGWDSEIGFPSEWQLYGEFLATRKAKHSAVVAGFANLGISRNVLSLSDSPSHSDCLIVINKLLSAAPKLGSLSLHAYKDL